MLVLEPSSFRVEAPKPYPEEGRVLAVSYIPGPGPIEELPKPERFEEPKVLRVTLIFLKSDGKVYEPGPTLLDWTLAD